MEDLTLFLGTPIIGPRLWPGYPYPERKCKHCLQRMCPVGAYHLEVGPEIFKAVYACKNKICPNLISNPTKAQMMLYYSCEEAEVLFARHKIRYRR